MFGLFKPDPIDDSQLGRLARHGGWWVGKLMLPRFGSIELRVAGGRKEPDARSIDLAARVPQLVSALDNEIARELFEHCTAGQGADDQSATCPQVETPGDVWPKVRGQRVEVNSGGREYTIEIACAVDWDEEHTLGLRLHGDRLVELNGSILL